MSVAPCFVLFSSFQLFSVENNINSSFPIVKDGVKNDIIRSREGEPGSAFREARCCIIRCLDSNLSLGISIKIMRSIYNKVVIESIKFFSLQTYIRKHLSVFISHLESHRLPRNEEFAIRVGLTGRHCRQHHQDQQKQRCFSHFSIP